jgi:hypothetical protein
MPRLDRPSHQAAARTHVLILFVPSAKILAGAAHGGSILFGGLVQEVFGDQGDPDE